MIKLLHAADFHLDSPFSNLPVEQAADRRQQQRELLTALPRLCKREHCRLVLLAGDLFDTKQIYRDTIELLRQALEACQVPVFIAPGNHDPFEPDSPYQKYAWPAQVHIFQTPIIQTVEFDDCTVSGAAFCHGAIPSMQGFRAPSDTRTHLMVLHGETAGVYATATMEEIGVSGLSYLAMGHIHKRSAHRTDSGVTYAWPGCLMGRGFDEIGEKGVYLVQTMPQNTKIRFQRLDAPRYEVLNIAPEQLKNLPVLLPADAKRHHYRIYLTGMAEKQNIDALQKKLQPYFASLQIIDHTRVVPSFSEETDSIAALFMQELKERTQTASDEKQRQIIELAMQLGLQVLEGDEVTLP